MVWTSDRRLWLTADRERVVEDGDAEAAFLLVGKGGELSDAEAKQYGLKRRARAEAADDDEDDEPAAKAVRAADVEDKGVRGPQRAKDR